MRTLHRRRDQQPPNQYTVTLAVTADEAARLGDMGSQTALDDLGVVEVVRVVRTDSPEPGLARDEQVLVLVVRTLETVGPIPDIP